jgi:hypothetical protein
MWWFVVFMVIFLPSISEKSTLHSPEQEVEDTLLNGKPPHPPVLCSHGGIFPVEKRKCQSQAD